MFNPTEIVQVLPFEDFKQRPYLSGQIGGYLLNYLNKLQAVTTVIENYYIDKDFLVDYSKFYARSFNAPDRFTQRIHFFSTEFDQSTFIKVLGNGDLDTDFIERLSKSYLGFIVLKPIKNKNGESFVGRTVLKTYPKRDGSEVRKFLTHQYKASLFGIPLEIESLPFQTQDQAVAACATTALWVALHPLSKLFQIPMFSPAEITEKAVILPGEGRNFPSSGLTLGQMIEFINFIGLDAENINIPSDASGITKYDEFYDRLIPDAVQAYIKAGFPVIACLTIEHSLGSEGHAVVISGYRKSATGQINELYVHDDQIGPYSRVKSLNNSFSKWENEWITKYGCKEVKVERIIVPIYPKIRLTFDRIYREYYFKSKKLQRKLQREALPQIQFELFLTQINEYKNFLLREKVKGIVREKVGNKIKVKVENKFNVLTKPLPKFIWVIRGTLKDRPVFDLIYDATDVFPKRIFEVVYL